MCENTTLARANRERVEEGFGNQFYAQQKRAIAGWETGTPAPKGVMLGSLPYVGKQARNLVREED